jgi:hypothetical protein
MLVGRYLCRLVIARYWFLGLVWTVDAHEE